MDGWCKKLQIFDIVGLIIPISLSRSNRSKRLRNLIGMLKVGCESSRECLGSMGLQRILDKAILSKKLPCDSEPQSFRKVT